MWKHVRGKFSLEVSYANSILEGSSSPIEVECVGVGFQSWQAESLNKINSVRVLAKLRLAV
jgi:hypothetical protein